MSVRLFCQAWYCKIPIRVAVKHFNTETVFIFILSLVGTVKIKKYPMCASAAPNFYYAGIFSASKGNPPTRQWHAAGWWTHFPLPLAKNTSERVANWCLDFILIHSFKVIGTVASSNNKHIRWKCPSQSQEKRYTKITTKKLSECPIGYILDVSSEWLSHTRQIHSLHTTVNL